MEKTETYFSIVGPTAVGKTDLALWLSQKIVKLKYFSGVDLISADSRQVYQGLEVLTGADIPRNFKRVVPLNPTLAYFSSADNTTRIYGLSIIKPTAEWSVAHFQQLAHQILNRPPSSGRIAIIVGGTGLYHQQLTNSDTSLHIPPNPELRNELQDLPVSDLQRQLGQINPEKLESLNDSDRVNPRRLMRAIEIEKGREQALATALPAGDFSLPNSVVTLGVTDASLRIKNRIEHRVRDRFSAGAQSEVVQLMANYENWSGPAFSTTGIREVRSYLEDRITAEECLQHWSVSEVQYAKRQQTWWKKREVTKWISIQESNWKDLAAETVFSQF